MTAESEYHSNFGAALASAGGRLSAPDANGLGEADPFARIEWFALLHRHCLDAHRPVIVGADNLPWLFLIEDGRGCARAMVNWFSFHWSPSAWDARTDDGGALAQMLAGLKRRFHTLTLGPVRTADGSAQRIADALSTAGWRVWVDESGHNHWLDTQNRSFDEWWAARPGALRSTVARKSKKNLVTVRIADRFSDADWDAYEHVYQNSWKPTELTPAFLRELAKSESQNGRLRLGLASIDGAPVATQFWLCDGETAYIHKLAHVSGHDALSPGTLLTHAMFRHAFDVDAVRTIDFGTGDDGYKRDWMEASAPLATIVAYDARQGAAWPAMARQTLSRLAAAARGR